MGKLNINFLSTKIQPFIEINGVNMPLRTNIFKGYYITVAGKTGDEIRIYTLKNELDSKWWFLKFLGYYVVSIAGIFDMGIGNNYCDFEYNTKINTDDDIILNFKLGKTTEGQKTLFLVNNSYEMDDNYLERTNNLLGNPNKKISNNFENMNENQIKLVGDNNANACIYTKKIKKRKIATNVFKIVSWTLIITITAALNLL